MNANVYDQSRTADTPQKAKTPARRRSGEWLAVIGLLLLSFIPIASGMHRLNQLGGGAQVTAENARFPCP